MMKDLSEASLLLAAFECKVDACWCHLVRSRFSNSNARIRVPCKRYSSNGGTNRLASHAKSIVTSTPRGTDETHARIVCTTATHDGTCKMVTGRKRSRLTRRSRAAVGLLKANVIFASVYGTLSD